MISTFYGQEKLVAAPTPATFLAALLVGLLFGFALEYAGFSSSRKLAGIFYFRDMTVLRVMFTALITAMLGLTILWPWDGSTCRPRFTFCPPYTVLKSLAAWCLVWDLQ